MSLLPQKWRVKTALWLAPEIQEARVQEAAYARRELTTARGIAARFQCALESSQHTISRLYGDLWPRLPLRERRQWELELGLPEYPQPREDLNE